MRHPIEGVPTISTRTPPSAPSTEAITKALAHVLRPLVRLCVHHGVTFPRLCDMLRSLYVNVVENDFPLPIKQQTDSRVSLLTGIHRKEVHRLRGQGAPQDEIPKSLSRTSRILAQWLAAPPFIDATGHPIPLPRAAADGAPSFEALVASVTRDIRPRAVLDDWLDRELVDVDPQEIVRLRVNALVPKAGDDQQLYYFGRNLHDHMMASVQNVIGLGRPLLERAVHYNGLSPDLARTLESRAKTLAMEMLQTANREAHLACEGDPGGSSRWSFGVYVYRIDEGAKPPRTLPSPAPRESDR